MQMLVGCKGKMLTEAIDSKLELVTKEERTQAQARHSMQLWPVRIGYMKVDKHLRIGEDDYSANCMGNLDRKDLCRLAQWLRHRRPFLLSYK